MLGCISHRCHCLKIRRNKTAMCSIVINSEAYLDEWVDYHHALGFDKFFIYDNSPQFAMKQWGKLKGDHVEVMSLPGERKQFPAYQDCFNKAINQFKWAAFFDVDEFLVLKQHEHVADMLEEFCPHGALTVNWFIYPSNGWNVYAPEPVTRRFRYRHPDADRHVKIIAKLDDIVKAPHWNPHQVSLKDKSAAHDSNGKKVRGPFNKKPPTDVVALNHYLSKSYQEYLQKSLRGRADVKSTDISVSKRIEEAQQMLADALSKEDLPMGAEPSKLQELVFDDSAWQLLKKNIPAYAMYDMLGLLK